MRESISENPERLAENKQEITEEVQVDYPNFKQKLAEKENFVISKVSESQPLFGKCRLRAARLQAGN